MKKIEASQDHLIATVRKLRTALEDTQQEFATRLGLAIATVVRYEHNRAPRAKALAKLEQVAAAHGLDEYAAIFHRALSMELGGPPPEPVPGTVHLKSDEERHLVLALLDVLRRKRWAAEEKRIRRILGPVVQERQRDAEFFEALEQSRIGIVRLLKKGHTAEEVMRRLGTSPERIAEAFFMNADPQLTKERMSEVVGLLLKQRWSIRRIVEEFGSAAPASADGFLACANALGFHRAVRDWEEEQEGGSKRHAKK